MRPVSRVLYACVFTGRETGSFPRMARVLEHSARQQCLGWTINIEHLAFDGRVPPSGMLVHAHNTQKLERWVSVTEAWPDGTELLLLDSDTCILHPLDDVWARPFDLAYTVKTDPFPFNLGVMFLRLSPAVRRFLQAWVAANGALFAEPGDGRPWRRRYGGINQAAFGSLREQGALAALDVLELPCAEWNCEESGWPSFDRDRTRIVHVKGELRRQVFGPAPTRNQMLAPIVTVWNALEAEALAAHRRTA